MNCQLDGIYEGRGLSLRSGIIALFDKLEWSSKGRWEG
jgi:hypothetical protein